MIFIYEQHVVGIRETLADWSHCALHAELPVAKDHGSSPSNRYAMWSKVAIAQVTGANIWSWRAARSCLIKYFTSSTHASGKNIRNDEFEVTGLAFCVHQ